jgi:hypothetical protein
VGHEPEFPEDLSLDQGMADEQFPNKETCSDATTSPRFFSQWGSL